MPGLKEEDFDAIAEAGIRLVKFIFYDYSLLPNGEAGRYVKWAKERQIKVKIHSGGVSRSGVSQVAGFDFIQQLSPDIVGHITGGPIPMPEEDVVKIVTETDQYLEICSSGNLRMAARLLEVARDQGAFGRVLVGTDTPGGTGVIPRGMLREIGFLSSSGRSSTPDGDCHGHWKCGTRSRSPHRITEGGQTRTPCPLGPYPGVGRRGCPGLLCQGRPAGSFGCHH